MADRALEIVSINDPAGLGLEPSILDVGDKILEVNGERTRDQVDFVFHTSGEDTIRLRVERKDGRVEEVTVTAQAVAELGISFKAMDFRRCRCKCPFCFVDQMPKGLRKSLYVKDEDVRLSFLYGNYTTMIDVTDDELDKIIRQKISPQWVSVHAIDKKMREYMFGRPQKRDIVETLTRLAEAGVAVHTQAVIVPGKNDGDFLRETIETLDAIHPNILTLAVVPVGLTRHRDGLAPLRTYRPEKMHEILDLVEPYRRAFLEGPRRSRFVFPSDEWYIGAAREVPPFDEYEGFPQLDNGVGMIRHFYSGIEEDGQELGLPDDLGPLRIVTGVLGRHAFLDYVFPLFLKMGVKKLPELVTVENRFFGSTVTCSGLLVAEDILNAVREVDKRQESPAKKGKYAKCTMIPPNCLNHQNITIDDMDLESMSSSLGVAVVTAGESFVDSLNHYAGGVGDPI